MRIFKIPSPELQSAALNFETKFFTFNANASSLQIRLLAFLIITIIQYYNLRFCRAQMRSCCLLRKYNTHTQHLCFITQYS